MDDLLPTTRTSVRLPLAPAADGRTLPEVDAFIDAPAEPRGRVILFHGFGRGPAALDRLAEHLAAAGLWVMRPHLRSKPAKGGMNDRDVMTSLGFAAAACAPEAGPLAIVGHSAGGAVAMQAAGALVEAGVELKGVVLVDSNGSIPTIMDPSLRTLSSAGVPVRTVAAAPGRCNRKAQIARWLGEQDLGFVGVGLTTGMHCDAEDEKADLACRVLCGGSVDPANAAIVRALTTGWTVGWIDGTDNPDLLPGGRRLQAWVDLGVIHVIG